MAKIKRITELKVKEWQKSKGLTPDGIIGPKSWAIILNKSNNNYSKKVLYVLLDNGHGNNTPGKRSPKLDNGTQFFEFEFCRKVVNALYEKIKACPEMIPIKITPETTDISLTTRVKRINQYCVKYGADNCIMISVHVNAAGNGGWMTGRGWSAWTTKGVNSSDKLAECLYDAADTIIKNNKQYVNTFNGQKIQKPIREDKSDGDRDFEAGFQILRGSNCAAVLTENFFMDNKQDVEYLISTNGFNDIVALHLQGIQNYYNKYKK